MAQRCLVIGSETLSRVVDVDRDSMIYSDGAGASIIEASDDDTGMLSYESGTMPWMKLIIYFLENHTTLI
jgi:3-oxoacyl-[acyl-carrier-protein] synthase-3